MNQDMLPFTAQIPPALLAFANCGNSSGRVEISPASQGFYNTGDTAKKAFLFDM